MIDDLKNRINASFVGYLILFDIYMILFDFT